MSHFEIPPFSDKGKDVSFGGAPDGKNEEAAKPPATSKMSMPTGPKAQFKNSMTPADGSDIPAQPRMGTWLTDDVPDLMRQNFRTVKSRDGWAYMGSSTGGFAGLKAVLKYPEKFKAAICSGPDIVPDSSLWRGHEKEKAENNPELLAKQLIEKKGPDVYLAFQVGDNENNKKTLPDVKKFIATYGKGPVHTSLRVIPNGQHNAKTYVPNMGEGPIRFISKVMEGPVE
ncbi:alpha/beta hydrolase [Streptomyces sp. NPDC059382]|uniref:alpha/beta hydrolase n=1 Tax=Streptomyces sp. NPDC059382 TaxID=3346816 RepID=UPI003685E368